MKKCTEKKLNLKKIKYMQYAASIPYSKIYVTPIQYDNKKKMLITLLTITIIYIHIEAV